jgi:hypothetical protein
MRSSQFCPRRRSVIASPPALRQFPRHDGTLQPAEVAVVKQPADHLLRDLGGARLVEFVAAGEIHADIEPG